MKSKIYWITLVLVATVIAVAMIWMRKPLVTEEEFVRPEEEKIEVKLKTGVGHSTNQDAKKAAQEAYTKMTGQLEGEKPIFVVLSSSVGYDQEQLLAEINRLLPGVKIYGYTSFLGVMTNDGFHIGEGAQEGYALGMMGFATKEMTFGVGACSLDEVTSPEEASRIAITRAIENAGKTKTDLPKIVLITTAPFGMGEELVIAGVESVLGKDVLLVGGVAATKSDFSGGQAIFANNKVYQKGVVVVPIYTNLKIGHVLLAGANPTGKKGIVTKFKRDSSGIYVVEIDHKPAALVYDEWSGGVFKKYLGSSEIFLKDSAFYMLGKKIIETGGVTNWQIVAPIHFNPDNSITVGAIAKEGTELYLLSFNPELFIKRPEITIRLARNRGEITEKEIAGVLMDQCGVSLVGIPQGISDWNKMISLINSAAGNTPFLGLSNFGPYGHFAGVGNRYCEVTTSVIVFSKD